MLLALHEVADRQLGVFTSGDAARAGYSPEDVRVELRSRRWARLRRGIYTRTEQLVAARSDPRALHQLECAAVLMALQRPVVVSHTSAARLLDVPVPRDAGTDVRLTDPGNWRSGRGYRVAQADIAPRDVVPFGPFRQTAPARTLVDCAREWSLVDAVIAMDDALHRHLLTDEELRAAVLAQRHWEGIGAAARAAGQADGLAESPLESAGRVHIVTSGLPAPALQMDVYDGQGFIGRVDGWYEEAGVVVEFDGAVKYLDPSGGRTPGQVAWGEKRREDRLRAGGARPLRITHDDVWRGWSPVRDRLRGLLDTPALPGRTLVAVPGSLRGVHRTSA